MLVSWTLLSYTVQPDGRLQFSECCYIARYYTHTHVNFACIKVSDLT